MWAARDVRLALNAQLVFVRTQRSHAGLLTQGVPGVPTGPLCTPSRTPCLGPPQIVKAPQETRACTT
jgi:hypothetical protein